MRRAKEFAGRIALYARASFKRRRPRESQRKSKRPVLASRPIKALRPNTQPIALVK